MALLASSSGVRATDSEQNPIPPVLTAKRQNEDEHIPALVLTPPADSGSLFADHSSHSSHSSHYSSSGGDDYVPPSPAYTPPTPPATPSPVYTPQAPSSPSVLPPPQITLLSTSVLNKLALLPSFWPKQVTLTQRFVFTKISDGVATGIIGAPSGTIVDLITVKGPKLIVSYLGNKAEIDAAITDIGDRVDANVILSAPLPTPPLATPPPTNGAP
jgi:hypothetical protein